MFQRFISRSSNTLGLFTKQFKRGYSSSQNSSSNKLLWGVAGGAVGVTGLYYYYNNRPQQQQPLDNLTPLSKDTAVIFVLGGPGAGKGTQCAKLVHDFGFVHLSAGDLLREERNRKGSPYGELINRYIAEGQIVPMEITIALLHAAMKQSTSNRFLIDGFPRKLDQAYEFEDKVCESKFVLFFDCPEAEMLKRLMKRGETSGRVDDNVESIKKRFQTFRDTSYPVVEYYEAKDKVRRVSCVDSIDKVYAVTKKAVETALKESEKK